jgi:hypothetical protein
MSFHRDSAVFSPTAADNINKNKIPNKKENSLQHVLLNSNNHKITTDQTTKNHKNIISNVYLQDKN